MGFSQSNEPFIDPQLSEAFESITNRGKIHGKDFVASLQAKGLTSIEVVDELPEGMIGYFERNGNSFKVQILSVCLEDPVSLEWTLAHELGHGLDMECIIKYLPDGKTRAWGTDIMYADGVTDPTHIVYQIMNSPKYSPEIWANYFKNVGL